MNQPCAKRWLRRFSISMGLLLLLIFPARADSLFLRGGERLQGRIISETGPKVIFESENLGRCEIPLERIERIERDPVVLAAPPITGVVSTNHFFPWSDDPTNRFDWIQLKSGEWLKGELKSLQERTLEFYSVEMDWLEFDWEDIWQVYSPRQNEALLDNNTKLTGPVHITRQQIRVQTPQGEQAFDRASLIAVTPGGPREINYWSGKISSGMTLRSGNTKQTEFNLDANLKRRTPNTRFTLDYLANLSRLADQETANNSRIIAQFDFWLSRYLYLKIPYLEYYRDPIQNIDHRVTIGAGVGYELIDRPRIKWDVVLGPAYQQIWFESVGPGEADSSGNGAAIFQSNFDSKITHRVDFVSQFQITLTPKESGGYTHHWQNTLEFKLSQRLELNISFIWDRVANPATSSTGDAAKPDDFRTILSLGVNF